MDKIKNKKKYIKKGGATQEVVTPQIINQQSTVQQNSQKPVVNQQSTVQQNLPKPVVNQQSTVQQNSQKPVVNQQSTVQQNSQKPVVNQQSTVEQNPPKPVVNQPKNKKNNNQPFTSNQIRLIHNPLLLKNNKDFPSFEFEGGDGFKTVKIILKPNEQIRADGGAMNYMQSDIKIETTSGSSSGSFFNAIGRLFSGSTFFYNIFYNVSNIPRDITLSGVIPGNIGCFYVPAGKSFNLVADSYICSTPNLDISTNIRFGGFLLGYGLTFVSATAKNGHGLIWSSSFGDVIEKIIEPKHSIKIDNGILLGFESHIDIQTQPIGGIKSTLFSKEGFVSEIINKDEDPMRIFLQSRSKTAFINYINDIVVAKR
jgi:uncharacterized protein (AIM24 family)